jgi:hypothetical protein
MPGIDEIPECTLSIGRKFYPRRYTRFRNLRDYKEAAEWSRALNWQTNPYERFLLKREILKQLEAELTYCGEKNVYAFASPAEIKREVEECIDDYPRMGFKSLDVIGFTIISIPWRLGFKHGLIEHSNLVAAVAQTR